MKGAEFRAIRCKLKLGEDEFALQLGYRGSRRNNRALLMRYERDSRQIPLTVASLAWLLEQYFDLTGELPVWPEWSGYAMVPDKPRAGRPPASNESIP